MPEQPDPVAAYQTALRSLEIANRNLINAMNAIHAAATAIKGDKWMNLVVTNDGKHLAKVTPRSVERPHAHEENVAVIEALPNPEQLRDLFSARRRALDAADAARSAVPQSRDIGLVAPRDLPHPQLQA